MDSEIPEGLLVKIKLWIINHGNILTQSQTNHTLQASAGALLIVLGSFVALLVFHICSAIKEGDIGERKESHGQPESHIV